MAKVIMGAADDSLDGFIADDHDGIGPIRLGTPSRTVQGDRVTHLAYEVDKTSADS